jgi:hypothetical protein
MALPLVSGSCCLGSDPEFSRSESGGRFRFTFSAAFNHKYLDKAGRKVEVTCWLPCVAWQEMAVQLDACRLHKGSWLQVEGRLEMQKRKLSEIWKGEDWGDHGRREIHQFELTIYRAYFLLPRLPGASPGGPAREGATG